MEPWPFVSLIFMGMRIGGRVVACSLDLPLNSSSLPGVTAGHIVLGGGVVVLPHTGGQCL